MSLTSFASKPLMIERQGQFPVGGMTIERPGTFNPDTFVGWTDPRAGWSDLSLRPRFRKIPDSGGCKETAAGIRAWIRW